MNTSVSTISAHRRIYLAILLALAAPLVARAQSPAVPELPRVYLDTTYRPQTNGTTHTVAAGGNLQAALNAASPGDTIALEAGATFTGNFILPAKTGDAWILIRTSTPDAEFLAPGVRVTPADAPKLARIVSASPQPAIRTAPGAHHYRLVGIEIGITAAVTINYGLVALGTSGTSQDTAAEVPRDLVLDRCYIHGNAGADVSRGVALNSAATAIIDSYISECHGVGFDTQAICGWNGPGPFKIVNNYLEGSGENVMFGGVDPSIPNLVPGDIEFRRNQVFKPLAWLATDPSFIPIPGKPGKHWTVKNLFELKNAERVLVDGNTFENSWVDGQVGYAIVLTPRNQSGTAPWSAVRDVTFTNNVVRNTAGGVNMSGYDNLQQAQQMHRVLVRNNLFVRIGAAGLGTNGRLWQVNDRVADLTIERNTAFAAHSFVIASYGPSTGFILRANIVARGTYGIIGTGTGEGLPTIARYFPDGVVSENVVIGGAASRYPAANFFPPTMAAVGFVDPPAGNYRLAPTSPYLGRGVDFDALTAAQAPPDPPDPPDDPAPDPCADLRTALAAAEARVVALTAEIATRTEERDVARAEAARLQSDLDAARAEIARLQAAIQAAINALQPPAGAGVYRR